MGNIQKQTPLQKAIAEIEARIKYLREQELIALNEIDELVAGSFMRNMKWKLINELAARRGELEMCSLKPLQALLPLEMEEITTAHTEGQLLMYTLIRNLLPNINFSETEKEIEKYRNGETEDESKAYFNKTYSAEK